MDVESPVFKLQVVTLLDSICFGLIYGFISPYLAGLGADQFVLGILQVGNLICTLLSGHIISNFAQIHGKRYTLYMIFNAALVSHLMMVLTNSYWFAIFSRYIFSLTHQSQNLCKDLLLEHTPEDQKDCLLRKHAILSGAGFIIGPFIAGCLFNLGFGYICLLATTLTFINTCLMVNISLETESPPQRDDHTVVEKTQKDINDVIEEFKKGDCGNNWDILVMRYLYLSSVGVFCSKFTQILKHNYNSSAYDIGYTSAYMNGINFAGMYFIESIKDRYLSDLLIMKTIEYGLLSSGILLLIACYSPVYFLYALICGPIFFSFNLMNSSWKDFTSTRENDSLNVLNKYIAIMAGLTSPLLFGLLHNMIGYPATILFCTVPIFTSFLILNKHTRLLFKEDGNKVKQD